MEIKFRFMVYVLSNWVFERFFKQKDHANQAFKVHVMIKKMHASARLFYSIIEFENYSQISRFMLSSKNF